ncbi:MAG TPA: efflux RND transporter periplasmic adaptor subunit [Polyangia bacterium]|nr:efflux RND transporter periplasmic adaptor subunit [Polyangia bacterium]
MSGNGAEGSRRRTGRVAAMVLVGGAGVVVAVGAWRLRRDPPPQPPAQATAAAEPAGRIAAPPSGGGKNAIELVEAQPMELASDLQLVGTVGFHEDRYAVVGPLVAGRVSRLVAGVGDRVKRGQVIAEIESAEVGQARAEMLAAKARLAAAEANLRRENDLADRKISSEREREQAQAQAATEQANVRAAVMRLRAIGLAQSDVEQSALREQGGVVRMRAPIDGTVIERKVTLGQAVERATDAFAIADASRVWVSLDLYEKDLFRVAPGQTVDVTTESRPGETFRGVVGFIVPVIDPATRTAKVRLELDNPHGRLQSGQLVTARLPAQASGTAPRVLAVPRSAIEQIEGRTVVFVETAGGFERRNVLTGRSAGEHVEIREGLKPGERVAARGAFLLKSELLR